MTSGNPTDGAAPLPPGPVGEWVEIAEGDFATARREFAVTGRRNLRAVGFHLQLAVEKIMKAVLLGRGVNPPKTHDLGQLDTLLRGVGISLCASGEDLGTLSAAAVESRYPGEAISPADAASLTAIAERAWARLRPLL